VEETDTHGKYLENITRIKEKYAAIEEEKQMAAKHAEI